MIKSDVVKAMRDTVGGGWFINKTDIAKTLSMARPESANKYVEGLQKVTGRLYYIPEVADKIMADVSN